jgi:hypothetical protein
VKWALAQLFPAPAFWFTRLPGQQSSPSGDLGLQRLSRRARGRRAPRRARTCRPRPRGMNTAKKLGPTHKQTGGRAPMWGFEFTTNAATLQKGVRRICAQTFCSGHWPTFSRAYGSRGFPNGRASRAATRAQRRPHRANRKFRWRPHEYLEREN